MAFRVFFGKYFSVNFLNNDDKGIRGDIVKKYPFKILYQPNYNLIP